MGVAQTDTPLFHARLEMHGHVVQCSEEQYFDQFIFVSPVRISLLQVKST